MGKLYMCLHRKKYFKTLLFKNHWSLRAEIYMKALWHNTKDSLLKSWSQESGVATIGETLFICVNVKGTYLKDLLKNQWAQRAQIYIKVFRHSTNASFLKSSSSGVGWGHNKGPFYNLKTVEFSTPKLNIFLFLKSKSIRWFVGHDHMGS
jgi:hypothetical protein